MIPTARVRTWMNPAETVSPDVTFRKAFTKMRRIAQRCLVVVEDERVVGVLTMGDIRHAMPADEVSKTLWEINRTWDRIKVANIMSPTVITVLPGVPVTHAAHLMLQHKISHLPVVNQQARLLGILNCYDLYRMLIAAARRNHAPREAQLATSGKK